MLHPWLSTSLFSFSWLTFFSGYPNQCPTLCPLKCTFSVCSCECTLSVQGSLSVFSPCLGFPFPSFLCLLFEAEFLSNFNWDFQINVKFCAAQQIIQGCRGRNPIHVFFFFHLFGGRTFFCRVIAKLRDIPSQLPYIAVCSFIVFTQSSKKTSNVEVSGLAKLASYHKVLHQPVCAVLTSIWASKTTWGLKLMWKNKKSSLSFDYIAHKMTLPHTIHFAFQLLRFQFFTKQKTISKISTACNCYWQLFSPNGASHNSCQFLSRETPL